MPESVLPNGKKQKAWHKGARWHPFFFAIRRGLSVRRRTLPLGLSCGWNPPSPLVPSLVQIDLYQLICPKGLGGFHPVPDSRNPNSVRAWNSTLHPAILWEIYVRAKLPILDLNGGDAGGDTEVSITHDGHEAMLEEVGPGSYCSEYLCFLIFFLKGPNEWSHCESVSGWGGFSLGFPRLGSSERGANAGGFSDELVCGTFLSVSLGGPVLGKRTVACTVGSRYLFC